MIIDCKYDEYIKHAHTYLYMFMYTHTAERKKKISIIVHDLKFNWHLLGNVEKAFGGENIILIKICNSPLSLIHLCYYHP